MKARGRLGAQEQNGAEEQARINLSTVAPEDYLFSVALLGLRHCELEPAALPAPLQQVAADLVNQSQAQEATFFALANMSFALQLGGLTQWVNCADSNHAALESVDLEAVDQDRNPEEWVNEEGWLPLEIGNMWEDDSIEERELQHEPIVTLQVTSGPQESEYYLAPQLMAWWYMRQLEVAALQAILVRVQWAGLKVAPQEAVAFIKSFKRHWVGFRCVSSKKKRFLCVAPTFHFLSRSNTNHHICSGLLTYRYQLMLLDLIPDCRWDICPFVGVESSLAQVRQERAALALVAQVAKAPTDDLAQLWPKVLAVWKGSHNLMRKVLLDQLLLKHQEQCAFDLLKQSWQRCSDYDYNGLLHVLMSRWFGLLSNIYHAKKLGLLKSWEQWLHSLHQRLPLCTDIKPDIYKMLPFIPDSVGERYLTALLHKVMYLKHGAGKSTLVLDFAAVPSREQFEAELVSSGWSKESLPQDHQGIDDLFHYIDHRYAAGIYCSLLLVSPRLWFEFLELTRSGDDEHDAQLLFATLDRVFSAWQFVGVYQRELLYALVRIEGELGPVFLAAFVRECALRPTLAIVLLDLLSQLSYQDRETFSLIADPQGVQLFLGLRSDPQLWLLGQMRFLIEVDEPYWGPKFSRFVAGVIVEPCLAGSSVEFLDSYRNSLFAFAAALEPQVRAQTLAQIKAKLGLYGNFKLGTARVPKRLKGKTALCNLLKLWAVLEWAQELDYWCEVKSA